MPILPHSRAVIRNGVTNILLSSGHSGRLYVADDVVGALNDGAAVVKMPITACLGITMLLCAFARKMADARSLCIGRFQSI